LNSLEVNFFLFSFWSVTNEDEKRGIKQRLQEWSAHIFQRVDEDTRHKQFDIHTYGSTILEAFGENAIGKVIKFKKVGSNFFRRFTQLFLDHPRCSPL
jgi:hypothetical protein